jgi:hypothetical protein
MDEILKAKAKKFNSKNIPVQFFYSLVKTLKPVYKHLFRPVPNTRFFSGG